MTRDGTSVPVPSPPLLHARGIERGYGRRTVLRGVDLSLGRGELVALLGPNGAGKTTLMKVLVGLLAPVSGRVERASEQAIGWVPQGGATYQRLTVRENLELFARLECLPGDAHELALRAATDADLLPWIDHLGSELSGGLRQRLNVAVGMLGDPQAIVLDEPATGVDLLHRTALFRVLRERADAGGSILFTTHALEDAAAADRVLVLVDGRMAYEGTYAGLGAHVPAALPGEPQDPAARGLLRMWDQGAAT